MNDNKNKSSVLFTPSGCLTGDALILFVAGSLEGSKLKKAEQHLEECPLCADAADGLRLWLSENKHDQPGTADSIPTASPGPSELPHKQAYAQSYMPKTDGSVAALFHSKTNGLNARIKQHLHAHALAEAEGKKRLSYKPFVWLAAAASIILFIGSFYVLWVQNQSDSLNMAQKSAMEKVTPQPIEESIEIVPDSTAGLAMNKSTKPAKQKAIATTQEVTVDADELNSDLEKQGIVEEQPENAVRETKPSGAIAAKAEMAQAGKPGAMDTTDIYIQEKPTTVAGVSVTASSVVNEKKSTSYTKRDATRNVDAEEKSLFTIVEEMPTFPGGEAGRVKFLAENITYPPQAAENGIQGTVYVSFIVKKNGRVADVKVLRGIGGGCDEEALRVVKMMPNWIPGKQNGKVVDVLYNMPVQFKLSR